MCWHPHGGKTDSEDGTNIVVSTGCDEDRMKFTWKGITVLFQKFSSSTYSLSYSIAMK